MLDMVGTTVIDDGRMVLAMTRALSAQGIEPGSARFERMIRYAREAMGCSWMTIFHELLEDKAKAFSANRTFEQAYDELISDGGVRPVPGAVETISWLQDAGVKVCLATGFGRHTQNTVLESLGWMGLVDLSICPADAGRGRPYPDMILTAALALDLEDVREAAVVGDTGSDITAGLRAGARMVMGVLTGLHTEAALLASGASAVIPSIKDLPALLAPRAVVH